jgi:hypothetical protein
MTTESHNLIASDLCSYTVRTGDRGATTYTRLTSLAKVRELA